MPKKKSTEEVYQDLKNLEKKVTTLEKFLNDEKKQKDSRLEKLDGGMKSLKIEVQSIDKNYEKQLNDHAEKLQKTIDQFNEFQQELEEELVKLEEKDKLLEELRGSVKEKSALLEDKEKTLKDLNEQHSVAVKKIAELETELADLKKKHDQVKTLEKELKNKLKTTEKEYSEFKDKEEPVLAQNESIRRLLNSTDQGKIYLALVAAHPNSLSIDDLSDMIDVTAVMMKPSLLAMEELEVIEFNPSTREVKLADL